MQDVSFRSPLRLAISSGATTPNPGSAGVVVWSTSENQLLDWNGNSWEYVFKSISPNFTGTPTAPTAATLASTTQLATTAYTMNTVSAYVSSRAQNLVTNGSGLLNNNYNFSQFIFNSAQVYSGGGSFEKTSTPGYYPMDELMPVNPDNQYRYSFRFKWDGGAQQPLTYGCVVCYDVDKLQIDPYHTMRQFDDTLAAPLNVGDTTIKVNLPNGWNNTATSQTHLRTIVVWGYRNSKGYTYPAYTYSRYFMANVYATGGINTSTGIITLTSPWQHANPDGGAWPIGTPISNGSSGGSFKYIGASGTLTTTAWQRSTGPISGTDLSGTNDNNKFHPGTAFVRTGFLLNYNTTVAQTSRVSNVEFGLDIESPTFNVATATTFVGALTGNATTADFAVRTGTLGAIDKRALKPTDVNAGNQGSRMYFTSKGGMDTGVADTNYMDALSLTGWGDSSGGFVNVLAISKSGTQIYLYQGNWGGSAWSLRGQLAYTNSNITGTAAGLSATLAPNFGGTGFSSYTVGYFLQADSTTTLAQRTPDQVRTAIKAMRYFNQTIVPTGANAGDKWLYNPSGIEYTYIVDDTSGTGNWIDLSSAGSTTTNGGGLSTFISKDQPINAGQYLWIQLDENGEPSSLWLNT